MYKSFQRVRVGRTKKKEKTDLDFKFEKRKEVQQKLGLETDLIRKHKLEDDLDDINDDIAKDCSEKYAKEINDHIGQVSDLEGRLSRNDYWHLKQKLMPKAAEAPSAKKDKNGMLVTHPGMLKDIYLEHYQHVLRQREILPHLKKHKHLREILFEIRLKKVTSNKSLEFTMEKLEKF